MIAALFVDRDGVYSGRSDVDCWDRSRDARLYAGPFPVVAHPPCETWGQMSRCRPEIRRGDDGGCFESALCSVERYGGVLEHPATSDAWITFRLPAPPSAGGWVRSPFRPGWSCHVEQRHYGHEARKATWLYYVGAAPPALIWGPSVQGRGVRDMPGDGKRRRRTPPAFAEVLLGLARGANLRSVA